MPWLMVRLPCGSRSTRSTFNPCSANATPRLSVVVVFATPPFWLAKEITRPIGGPLDVSVRIPGRGSRRASPMSPFLRSHASYPSGNCPPFSGGRERLREDSRQGGGGGRGDHDHGQGRSRRDRDSTCAHSHESRVQYEAAVAANRLRDHERREQDRCKQDDDASDPDRQRAP